MISTARALLILLITSNFLIPSALASSWCSCEGQAEGIPQKNSSQLAHEKLIKIDPDKTNGKKFQFKFSCWDSAPGQGSNSIEIVRFIE